MSVLRSSILRPSIIRRLHAPLRVSATHPIGQRPPFRTFSEKTLNVSTAPVPASSNAPALASSSSKSGGDGGSGSGSGFKEERREYSPPPPKTKARASFRQRLVAFLTGAGAAALFGYFRLHSDIWDSTAEVNSKVNNLKVDFVESEQNLLLKIKALEERLAKLETPATSTPSDSAPVVESSSAAAPDAAATPASASAPAPAATEAPSDAAVLQPETTPISVQEARAEATSPPVEESK